MQAFIVQDINIIFWSYYLSFLAATCTGIVMWEWWCAIISALLVSHKLVISVYHTGMVVPLYFPQLYCHVLREQLNDWLAGYCIDSTKIIHLHWIYLRQYSHHRHCHHQLFFL